MKENYLRLTPQEDVIFKKKLLAVTTENDVVSFRELSEFPELSFEERQKLEKYLHVLKEQAGFDTYYDLVLGLMECYDYDISSLMKNTYIGEKLKAEKSRVKRVNMMELF